MEQEIRKPFAKYENTQPEYASGGGLDVIAAVATGGAVAAIGIVRMSGRGSVEIADMLFKAAGGEKLSYAKSGHMYYGKLFDAEGALIDMCLCFISRAPGSYTGEDTVEFHCHGSPVVLAEVLRSLFAGGARQARAGEFTKRAFLNGRVDLTQAEAVIDIIEAETAQAVRNAAGQLNGAICIKLNKSYSSLLDLLAHFHALIDYPDEDIDEFEIRDYIPVLKGVKEEVSHILSSYSHGRVLRDGIPAVIIGRPNTGKSSLLNVLLGYERAIVTDIAGTTRDTVEEKVLIGGILLRLIDTAGLRRTEDKIEQLGVGRALDALENAMLAIVVFDGSQQLSDEDYEVLDAIPAYVKKLIVVNKADLPSALDSEQIEQLTRYAAQQNQQKNLQQTMRHETKQEIRQNRQQRTQDDLQKVISQETQNELQKDIDRKAQQDRLQVLENTENAVYCQVCALSGEGIDKIATGVTRLFPEHGTPPTGDILTNERQEEALRRAKNSLSFATDAIEEGVTPDAVLTEIEAALIAIGEVTGKTVRDDVISRIFDRFCVGK